MASLLEKKKSLNFSESLIDSSVSALSKTQKDDLLANLQNEIKWLVTRQKLLKTKINILLKKITSEEEPDISLIKEIVKDIYKFLQLVTILDLNIASEITEHEYNAQEPSFLLKILKESSDYKTNVNNVLAGIKAKYSLQSHSEISGENNLHHDLSCFEFSKFSGDEAGKTLFITFFDEFVYFVDSQEKLSSSLKMHYLKNALSGSAAREIAFLPCTNSNYPVALKILIERYLDIDYIVNSTLRTIYSSPTLDGRDLTTVRDFLAEIRTYIYRLQILGLDFIAEETGNIFLTHVIMDKLPLSFVQELKAITRNYYPTISDIFDNYSNIINSMEEINLEHRITQPLSNISKNKKDSLSSFRKHNNFNTSQENSPYFPHMNNILENKKSPPQTLPSHSKQICKLCLGSDHTITFCKEYATPEARRNRCLTLLLCQACSSARHNITGCPYKVKRIRYPCSICKHRDHITALCPNGGNW